MGTYSAPALTITGAGKLIARIKPIGANIIGGSGQIDIIGPLDQQLFMDLLTEVSDYVADESTQ